MAMKKPIKKAAPKKATSVKRSSGGDGRGANRVESYGTPYRDLNVKQLIADPKLSGFGASKPLTNYRKGLQLAKARTEHGNVYEVKDKAGNITDSRQGYKGNSYFGAPRKPAAAAGKAAQQMKKDAAKKIKKK